MIRRKKKLLDRGMVFNARPVALPVHFSERREDGGLDLSVAFPVPRWHRMMGAKEAVYHKKFQLDRYGAEVYRACDGTRSVRSIVREFAEHNDLSLAEAEVSVTAFLKMLIQKRLVHVALQENERQHA